MANTAARRRAKVALALACVFLLACLAGCAANGQSSGGSSQASSQLADSSEIIGIIGAMDAEVDSLKAAAVNAAREAAPYINVHEGRVCSGDQFISAKEQKGAIVSNFGGLCCEMEGAAIAQAYYLNNVPFVVVRSISDKPSETGVEDYRTFEPRAAALCAAIVEHMVKSI